MLAIGDLLLRFKKLDGEYGTSNYPTPMSLNFDGQIPIASIPDGTRATVGYIPDPLGSELLDVVIVCHVGKDIAWHFSIADADLAQVQRIAADKSTKSNRKVTAKSGAKKKASSNG